VDAYDSDKLGGALARALTPQSTLQRTAAGTPATEADFYRIHEEACTLLLLQPQLAYWFAHRATNLTRAHLRQTVATLEDLIVSLVDALTPSVPVTSTEALSAAQQHLEVAARVSSLGTGTRAAASSLSRALAEVNTFSQQLAPNVAPRVGDRTVDTAYAIGDEALATVLEHMETLDKQYRGLVGMLSALRISVPRVSTELLRQKVTGSLVQRAQEAVGAAAKYYEDTPPEEAMGVSSAVLANLHAFSVGTQLVDAARHPLTPKVLSPQLQLDSARGQPVGSSYQLVPVGDPDPLTATLTPTATLPAGATVLYSHDGGGDTVVPIPGAGVYSLLGNVDLSTVTLPNPAYLYVEQAGLLTPILLTPGAQSISQVVTDINAVIPGFASEFGSTGRLLLSSAQPFTIDTAYTAEVSPSLTSNPLVFALADWQGLVLEAVVQDAGGVHYQTHTFPAPFVPAVVADVVTELSALAFLEDAGIPVLAVSSPSGTSLMLSAVAQGDVTISVSMFSTIVTGGHISWPVLLAYGRSAQGGSVHTTLGLETTEASLDTDPQVIVDAINDVDSQATATLESTGAVTIQVDAPSLVSSLEMKAGGAVELGVTPGLTRASASQVEITGVAADGSAEGTPDPELLGVQVGDRVRISSGSEAFDVSVLSLTDERIVVDSGVPGDIGASDVRVDDGAMQQFENLGRSMDRVRSDLMPIRSPQALHEFHLRWMQRLTGRALSPGDAKKALEVYVGILNVLTLTLDHQADVDARLATLGLAWSPVSPTIEEGLEENEAPPWAGGTADAGKSMLQSFEERGYDRAVELLNEGRLRDFTELTPLTASRAGRVEAALMGTVEAMRSQVT
jgi:hypothetical protein